MKRMGRWNSLLALDNEVTWSCYNIINYRCTIETQLSILKFSFSHSILSFHDDIGLSAFMYKIKKKTFYCVCFVLVAQKPCINHLFCECPMVLLAWYWSCLLLWHKSFDFMNKRTKKTYLFSTFNILFGVNINQGFNLCIIF